jgi:hypothetical protein
MPKLRVVIGQGTAAEVFQSTVGQNDGEYQTIVIGSRGLWTVLPNTHRMGQPSHLLTLPRQQVPQFRQPTGRDAIGLTRFMDVNSYQTGLNQLAGLNLQLNGRAEYPGLRVTGIERVEDTGRILVRCSGSQDPQFVGFAADQVIIATGIGPQQSPTDARIQVIGQPQGGLGFVQIEEGIDYLTHADNVARDVIVYGGSATGAWVAHEVRVRAHGHAAQVRDWAWMARPGGSGFSGSQLPGDRNWEVLQDTHHQVYYAITHAEYVAPNSFRAPSDGITGFPTTHKVKLTLRPEQGDSFPYYADQLIYCLGGNPAGNGSIASMLDDDLVASLEPLRDQNRMISDGTGTLAWCTPSRDLIIVGSATYNFSERAYNKQKQNAPMSGLPTNAQVPDGITVTVSAIEALNQYMPAVSNPRGGYNWTVNFNTSNQTQIAAYIASETDIEPFAANIAVALIVHFRSRRNREFGITGQQVNFILLVVQDWLRAIRQFAPLFETARLNVEHRQDRSGGADDALQMVIASMTSPAYDHMWAQGGL